MKTTELSEYYKQIEEYPSYAALGMVFKATIDQVAENVWEGNHNKAMEQLIEALKVAEKVEEYYDVEA